jgi:nuclear pore complex protein Nup107
MQCLQPLLAFIMLTHIFQAAGQRDLIAQYAGALGDNAVRRYALFLTSLTLSTSADERRAALVRAREHGLDVQAVAIAAAEHTINRAFAGLSSLKGDLPEIRLVAPDEPGEARLLLLRSIEWTTFNETTYATALKHANVILRYFLACGEFGLARAALASLPRDLAQLADVKGELAAEHVQYRQLFMVWDALDRVHECAALDTPGMSRETRTTWLADYRVRLIRDLQLLVTKVLSMQGLIDQAREHVYRLLTSEWLINNTTNVGGMYTYDRLAIQVVGADRLSIVNDRLRELLRIRQIFVPELILRMHEALVRSRHRIPEYVLPYRNLPWSYWRAHCHMRATEIFDRHWSFRILSRTRDTHFMRTSEPQAGGALACMYWPYGQRLSLACKIEAEVIHSEW